MLSIKIYIKHSNYRIFYYKTLLKFMRTSFGEEGKKNKKKIFDSMKTSHSLFFYFLENLKGQECLWKK